tara:strand:- start:145 stop:339 length:195 start_codon:yes stop_codon:yes gene_type:complete
MTISAKLPYDHFFSIQNSWFLLFALDMIPLSLGAILALSSDDEVATQSQQVAVITAPFGRQLAH